MDFEIELIASTDEDGGLSASFTRQLESLGGTATLVSEVTPYRVDAGNGIVHFEARRTYHIVL